jgi:hypothetical protein
LAQPITQPAPDLFGCLPSLISIHCSQHELSLSALDWQQHCEQQQQQQQHWRQHCTFSPVVASSLLVSSVIFVPRVMVEIR